MVIALSADSSALEFLTILSYAFSVLFQLVEDSMVKLDRICREANIILIFARSYGLMGLVRISVKEHTVIESKPDHFLDDLRLNDPWPELQRSAVSHMLYFYNKY
ncbi:NEDD8-activating enzyme E1 regulatory subunit AXL-like [Capsicum annuum]|uniref:NEDD8-activating enzyme E1 regulatory subunit AXL-like n=1 Tax=Capsicum annuum TaxID=4072 RepID=UPI001FB15CC6|nr:NEDD8-activating enzyme E1 regulatory subunit AXL-like [Capsicum annuum]